MEEKKTRFLREIILFESWCCKTGIRHRWCPVSYCSFSSKHLLSRCSDSREFTTTAVRVPSCKHAQQFFVSAAGKFKVAVAPNQLLLVQEIELIVGWNVDYASAIAEPLSKNENSFACNRLKLINIVSCHTFVTPIM